EDKPSVIVNTIKYAVVSYPDAPTFFLLPSQFLNPLWPGLFSKALNMESTRLKTSEGSFRNSASALLPNLT
ncbi:hypothetical protein M1M99_02990, partial [Thermodesulfovibrionales bacterium]|nr:hypothetical protein [Thermodesulfovibrionales bacterium]